MSDNEDISLGINIGSMKTVYSTFSKIDDKNYITKVLLMNNSSRTIPSIICYTKTHRLFGENSYSVLKQNLETSYNNLSRIFGFDKRIQKLYKEEHFFGLKKMMKIEEYNLGCCDLHKLNKEISTSNIVSDFLYLINDYFFNKENINYNSTSISVPDFYYLNLKIELKLICEAIGMKDVKIFNESSAITMYYGYTKYKDIFLNKENEIDPNKKY